jgi:hypothetical protein
VLHFSLTDSGGKDIKNQNKKKERKKRRKKLLPSWQVSWGA